MTIALAGKGGSGKTSVAALTIRYLKRHRRVPILAVDADPNANLGEALGTENQADLAAILAEVTGQGAASIGTDKLSYVESRVYDALVEGDDVDLIAMGVPDKPGCFCFANSVLRDQYSRLAHNYPYIVFDNEAGLEHLSRRTTNKVDILAVVSDASIRGVRSAGRVASLAATLGLEIKKSYLIITKVRGELSPELVKASAETGLELAGMLPYDDLLVEYDATGRALVDLPDDAPVVKEFGPVLEKWLDTTEK